MSLLNCQGNAPRLSLLETYFPEAIPSFTAKTGLHVKDFLALQESDEFYQALIRRFENMASQSREIFLATDPEVLAKLPFYDLAQFLRVAYQELSFSPDEEVLRRFEGIGINRRLLTRFIPLKKISEQIDLITADGEVKMRKASVLLQIKDYLDKQIAVDLFHLLELTAMLNGRVTTNLELAFSNAYRRRKYSGGAPLQYDMGEQRPIDSFIDSVETFIGEREEARKLLSKTAGGNTDKLLFKAIEKMCTFERTRANKRQFITLFQLLTTRYAFLSKQDLQQADRFYGQYHPTYLAKRFDHLMR